eukprot:s2514_g2.t1
MSRLMTKNPVKALEVGHALLSYLKDNPGDLHYGKDFANDGWGERGQLKCQRNQHSIEIYSDIAYAAGSSHRSIQGVAVFFAGSPIAWQSSQQPFATHSTAESELVSYCESLLIGRATEALLCHLTVSAAAWQRIQRSKDHLSCDMAAHFSFLVGQLTKGELVRFTSVHQRLAGSVGICCARKEVP